MFSSLVHVDKVSFLGALKSLDIFVFSHFAERRFRQLWGKCWVLFLTYSFIALCTMSICICINNWTHLVCSDDSFSPAYLKSITNLVFDNIFPIAEAACQFLGLYFQLSGDDSQTIVKSLAKLAMLVGIFNQIPILTILKH